ncbi:MAG: CDP-glycerol glycerophosphotransferase family protein [Kiritimatiellae bacterium]|nr:CDP-glycerol glycerophosphotransferase family protein [Kiritimatiellia bacterium]
MIRVAICVYFCFLRMVYALLKLLPQNPRKVLFLSRQSDTPSLDFQLLGKEFEAQGYVTVSLFRLIKQNLFEFVRKESFGIFRQMYHLATARYCVTDTYNLPLSVLRHRPNLKIVQIEHGIANIKKFGKQVFATGRREQIARLLRIHAGYSWVLASTPAIANFLSEALGYDLAHFRYGLLPRIDALLTDRATTRREILARYPRLATAKVILYVSTFRESGQQKDFSLLQHIPEEYVVIPNFHPLWQADNALPQDDRIVVPTGFTSQQLLSVADYVVTDYSSFIFEAMALDLPVYFYIPDHERYFERPGVNVNVLEEMPSAAFVSPQAFYAALDQPYDWEAYRRFKTKYLWPEVIKPDTTKRLVRLILET